MAKGSDTNPFNPTPPVDIPVPEDRDRLMTQLPEILRQIANRILIIERDIYTTHVERINESINQSAQLSQSQLAMQQSLNLLQAAHNQLHDLIHKEGSPSAPNDRRKRIMEAKLSMPMKFAGTQGPSDPSWRV